MKNVFLNRNEIKKNITLPELAPMLLFNKCCIRGANAPNT